MSVLGTYTKQPSEVLDYDINFSDWLGSGTIFSQTASVEPTGGLSVVQSSIMVGAKAVKVICGGGADGVKYKVTVQISTNSIPALIKEAEFFITCKET